MGNIKPITPAEVVDKKIELIPDFVLAAFNIYIAEHWDGRQSTFKQSEVVDYIKSVNSEFIDYKWLDIEPIYWRAGWKVEYDKPGYNESYPATFTFTRDKI